MSPVDRGSRDVGPLPYPPLPRDAPQYAKGVPWGGRRWDRVSPGRVRSVSEGGIARRAAGRGRGLSSILHVQEVGADILRSLLYVQGGSGGEPSSHLYVQETIRLCEMRSLPGDTCDTPPPHQVGWVLPFLWHQVGVPSPHAVPEQLLEEGDPPPAIVP